MRNIYTLEGQELIDTLSQMNGQQLDELCAKDSECGDNPIAIKLENLLKDACENAWNRNIDPRTIIETLIESMGIMTTLSAIAMIEELEGQD